MPKTVQDWGALLGVVAVLGAALKWILWPLWIWQHRRTSRAAQRIHVEGGKTLPLDAAVAVIYTEQRDMKAAMGGLQAAQAETETVLHEVLPALRETVALTRAASERTEKMVDDMRRTLDQVLLARGK